MTMTYPEEATYPPCPLTPRTLRRAEVTLLASLYFPIEEIDNAVDVAQLESGWRTEAWNNDGEDSRGLWQINVAAGAHPNLRDSNLFDPQVNAWYAAIIWRTSSWRAWYNSAIKLNLL